MSVETRQVILIVDDNIANLKVAVENLKAHSLDVITARSGEAGLERARFARPDLILLDIDLPGIDGFEACRRIKADSATRDIPVIFMTALADVEHKVRGFAAGGVDYITKPIQVEELHARVDTHLTIRRLQQSLEERIKELDAFAHTVAHDLKNPLAAVIGYVQLIESLNMGALPENARMALAVISQNSYKMSSIINELLTLASVRNLNDIAIGPLMMGRIVNDTMTRLSRLIETSGAEIALPQRWPVAHGYGPWVEEVWANYISNAIKYGGTPPQIELGADRIVDDNQRPCIRFWIRDNGRGMAEAELGQLFREFSRLDQHRSLEGHGLGLSIVQRIVKKLGGSVGVESTVGSGSSFSFILPAAEHAAAPSDTITTASALPQIGSGRAQRRPMRVLVVDDNPTNRLTLSISLKQQGHQVTAAQDGRRALELLRAQSFDLVLLEIVIPEMDGFEVLANIKSDPALRDIPVIVISAVELMESVIRCIEIGAEDYLPKPCDPVLLEARITASLQKKRFRDQEIEYLRQVAKLTEAAVAMENQAFDPASLADVSVRSDALGSLSRVFQHMAQEVYAREQQLAQDNRVKAAFIDVISHELRSPFASAALSVELLRKYAERRMIDELQEQIEQVNKDLVQGRQLIDTILAFARQVGKDPQLVVAQTDLPELVRETIAPLAILARRRQLQLVHQLAPEMPSVYVDRERMSETIYHLVHNAIKFSRAGGVIEVKCWAEGLEVLFQVKDTGSGIPAERLATMWNAWEQNSDRVRRGVEGLGLGLALVKSTVEAHRGKVAAISTPGQGSTFSFSIPLEHTSR
jgi:two-component system, sensor histidine kinase and response regulator